MEKESDRTNEHRIQTLNLDSINPRLFPEITGNSEQCYSLLNSAVGDEETKKRLQQERLKYVLDQLQREREDTSFSRDCLFCKKHFTGNRSVFLDHLLEQHNFTIGAPDNIVFINELLDILEKLLKNLQCLYCEKIFKDWMTLKEHMRKKQHKRINPENKYYDKFYIINYLELGKTWIQIQKDDDSHLQEENETEMDWKEDSNAYVCLFCESKLWDFDQILSHMQEEHNFDLKKLIKTNNLDFYKQVKLINYLRKKVYEKECFICDGKFCVQEDLNEHLESSRHISLYPDPGKWDQPLYFFSTFENDNLLCGLDTEETDCQDYTVLPEDTFVPESILNEELLKQNFEHQ